VPVPHLGNFRKSSLLTICARRDNSWNTQNNPVFLY